MAVQSQRTRLGTPLPEITLRDLDAKPVSLRELRGDGALLLVWSANHCPYVRHVERELAEVLAAFEGQDLKTVAIASNDTSTHPADGPEGMREQIERAGWRFPYVRDADQAAAQAFGAVCTPDFFLYDAGGLLAYRGAFDTSTPKNGEPLDGSLLRDAITKVLAGEQVPEPHRPAMGCGIKWLPGNEPATINFV